MSEETTAEQAKETRELTPEELEEHKKIAQEIFDEFDYDKSGLIDANDVEKVFRKWSEVGSWAGLTEDEIKNLSGQFFKQTDANADIKVTFDEVYNTTLKEGGICLWRVL